MNNHGYSIRHHVIKPKHAKIPDKDVVLRIGSGVSNFSLNLKEENNNASN